MIFILDTSALPFDYVRAVEVGVAEGIGKTLLEDYAKATMGIIRSKKVELDINTWNQMQNYYNTFRNGMTEDKEINFFLHHGKLEGIGTLFRLFIRVAISQDGNSSYRFDFGLKQSHYNYWKKNGKVPNVKNKGGTPGNLLPAGEPAGAKITFRPIDLPKSGVYERFTTGIKNMNKLYPKDKVTIPSVTLLAMEEYMESRKEIFYDFEIEREEREVYKRKSVETRVRLDDEVTGMMSAIVQRYNAKNSIKITQEQFIEQAIKAHIQRIPVEYTDPKLAEKIKNMDW